MLDPAVLAPLLAAHWYDAAADLIGRSAPTDPRWRHAHRLAEAATRVLDLDAEDFALIARDFDEPWAQDGLKAPTPQEVEAAEAATAAATGETAVAVAAEAPAAEGSGEAA